MIISTISPEPLHFETYDEFFVRERVVVTCTRNENATMRLQYRPADARGNSIIVIYYNRLNSVRLNKNA